MERPKTSGWVQIHQPIEKVTGSQDDGFAERFEAHLVRGEEVVPDPKRISASCEACPFFHRVLAVMDGQRRLRTFFQEINQPGSHMIDMVAHRRLCAFAIVGFEGFQDSQVGVGGAGRRQIVGLTSAQPDLILDILEHAA